MKQEAGNEPWGGNFNIVETTDEDVENLVRVARAANALWKLEESGATSEEMVIELVEALKEVERLLGVPSDQ